MFYFFTLPGSLGNFSSFSSFLVKKEYIYHISSNIPESLFLSLSSSWWLVFNPHFTSLRQVVCLNLVIFANKELRTFFVIIMPSRYNFDLD